MKSLHGKHSAQEFIELMELVNASKKYTIPTCVRNGLGSCPALGHMIVIRGDDFAEHVNLLDGSVTFPSPPAEVNLYTSSIFIPNLLYCSPINVPRRAVDRSMGKES